jgi:hypothetical protein
VHRVKYSLYFLKKLYYFIYIGVGVVAGDKRCRYWTFFVRTTMHSTVIVVCGKARNEISE